MAQVISDDIVIVVLGNVDNLVMQKRVQRAVQYDNAVRSSNHNAVVQFLMCGGSCKNSSNQSGADMLDKNTADSSQLTQVSKAEFAEISSEASFMRDYAISLGIEANRIILELNSTTTVENFLFAKIILDNFDTKPKLVICTSTFHTKRAAVISKFLIPVYECSFIHTNELVTRESEIIESSHLQSFLDWSIPIVTADLSRSNLINEKHIYDYCVKYCKPDCRYENFEQQKCAPSERAFLGLNSSWIVPTIAAMQRPSNSLIDKYEIIKQFKQCNIVAVFNLQECGEHAHCSDGITSNGFSYDFFEFEKHDIKVHNFGWKDVDVPSFDLIQKAVIQMDKILSDPLSKVTVHCHAGLGRTGILIACYLIFKGMSSNDAVRTMQERRSGALRDKKQISFCSNYSEKLDKL